MEFTSDAQGNKYFGFVEEDEYLLQYESNQIGNKLMDFEILQVLSEGKDNNNLSFVTKVRSLKNNKIYSMKKINISGFQEAKQNIYTLMNNLKKINHPHIVKYYNFFEENNFIYLIMEYMDNSDILGYIQGYQIFDKQIPETEIWNILLQCLSALDHLNSLNYGNIGIKITNIFINNTYNIKIGVFKDLVFNGQYYSPKEELDLLQKYFHVMINSRNFEIKKLDDLSFINELKVEQSANIIYSNTLTNIIYNNFNGNVSELYKKVKDEYSKKYIKNSSIKAVLRCLSSHKLLTDRLKAEKQLIEINRDKYYMSYWYIKTIEALKGINENNLQFIINDFRRALACTNFKLDGNKEIDPLMILVFILNKIHREMNKADKKAIIEAGYNKYNINNDNIKNYVFNGEEHDRTNKEQILREFINYFNITMQSPISDLFISFMKTKRICQICRSGYYFFSNFLYIVFDLEKEANEQQPFDLIKDGFLKNFSTPKTIDAKSKDKKWCQRCQSYQDFKEFNRYFMVNNQLIICFLRGNNYQNHSKIIFNEKMNIKDFIEPGYNFPMNFELAGCVNRKINDNTEEFVSYSKDPDNENKWIPKDFKNIQSNVNEQIIMLFYISKDIVS